MARARLSYPDVKGFFSIVDALSKIVDEVAMTIKPDGVSAIALDPAHVALVKIELPPESFLEYDVSGEVKLGFNVANTGKILKRGKKGDRLDIVIEDEYVTWIMEGATVKRYKVLNLDVPAPEIPSTSFQFNIHVQMIVDPFRNAIKDAEAVGDTVEFEAPNEEEFIIRGIGSTTAEAKIKSGTPAMISYEVKEPGKAAYSIDYLKHILSLTKVADEITIEFSDNMPLRLEFAIPAGGRVEYFLAPKEV